VSDPNLIAIVMAPRDLLLLGGAILAVALVMMGTRNRMRNRNAATALAREPIADVRQRQAAREDMQELMVQLEELSRRIGAQIDTRFQKLETVIADADDRIARLEAAVRAARGVPALDITVGDENVPRDAQPDRRPLGGTKPAGPPPDADPQRSRIHRLADEGKTPVEIARLTGVKPGEVELILALREGSRPA
jgi:hypothetical protein